MAETRLGPAPIDYVWVAAGSQARNEQTAKSDQDNCLILHDSYREAVRGAYFKAFSKFVCDGLDQCGYIHCPGDMMAMTDTWRQPRQTTQRKAADNFLALDELSNFERSHRKEAFSVVQALQSVLGQRYQSGRFQ